MNTVSIPPIHHSTPIARKCILIMLCLAVSSFSLYAKKHDTKAARNVIERFAGKNLNIELSINPTPSDGCDEYKTSVENGRIKIAGSSPVALCRGFYDIVKTHNAGIFSWSGNRFDPSAIPYNSTARHIKSPFRDRYYFNVVTYGYTMPYWNWERWEREIDWMALHGIDMPLALVAQEAISKRVWKKLGLTDEEIDNYFVGPAHLPWMRMGNISGVDGPLPDSWHKNQIALQHKILNRMRALGMKPICPGFAGFVPKSITRLFSDVEIVETSWSGGAFHNWMLSPDNELFRTIGRMYIEEWEHEFGTNERYIVDSFNEMDIPFPPKGDPKRYKLLANYGEAVYNSIHDGNPNATWVMQGWMFGYQRHIWDCETLAALVSRVPDDKMMLLDLAEDYNHLFWRNGANWDFYKGFFGKDWVYSVIPNMGGKSGMTGDLEFYANGGRLKVLSSENRGHLTGYGTAPEGIENNEVIYELITDGAWTTDSIDLNKWLDNYTLCRYGASSPHIKNYWQQIRRSAYGSFTDHPRFNWQFRPGTIKKGTINTADSYFESIEAFSHASSQLSESNLYTIDLIELTAQYLGGRLESVASNISNAYQSSDTVTAIKYEQLFEEIAIGIDRLLASHPTLRLNRWLDFARSKTTDPTLKKAYKLNARRIVTVWGPPVDDYSARIWSGLVGSYYLPRWKLHFSNLKGYHQTDIAKWELDWIADTGTSVSATPYSDPVAECLRWIERTKHIRTISNN